MSKSPTKRRLLRLQDADLKVLRYIPREIHSIMGHTSHVVIALMAQVREQEKFRADPRFPLFRTMEYHKRYQKIFSSVPYGPIFS